MEKAFVLINCELGHEGGIIADLKELEYVKNVSGTYGAYDIIAEVIADTRDKLRETITWKIRKMTKIRSTLTLTTIEDQT